MAELKKRNRSYADLAEKLTVIGIKETDRNISNCHTVHLGDE